MAIKNIIAGGIGFAPGSISFIPTLGFSISIGPAITTIFTRDGIFSASLGRDATFNPSNARDAGFQVIDSREGNF